jgi:hypothetical protein
VRAEDVGNFDAPTACRRLRLIDHEDLAAIVEIANVTSHSHPQTNTLTYVDASGYVTVRFAR